MVSSRRQRLLLSAAAALLAQAAHAQSVAPPAPATRDSASLSEVVVTAQRRPEHLIDVPASVAVVSADRLAVSGVRSSLELGQVTPGVSIDPQGASAEPTIRGVGTTVTSVGNSANVAIYVDGIYQASQQGNFFDLTGVDRMEILKGPQGTLYGRNATGGAILITTKTPSFSFGGEGSVSYGSFGTKDADVYVTGPITDKLAVSLAVDYGDSDGYMENIFLHKKTAYYERESARAKLLYKPTDWANFTLSLDHSFTNDSTSFSSAPLNGNTVARSNPSAVLVTGPYQISQNFNPIQKFNSNGATLKSEFFLSWATLTSYTGYRKVDGRIDSDSDFSSLPTNRIDWQTAEAQTSEEVTLTSVGHERFRWLAGASWNNEDARYNPYISNLGTPVHTNVLANSYSGYGELTYDLTDKLTLTGGARYTSEDKHYQGSQGTKFVEAEKRWDAWTPRVSAKYQIAEHTNIYATYSEGFKSGGFNAQALSTTPFNPETVNAYEVGVKSQPLPALSVEAAAFHYDYKDIQFQAATPQVGTQSATITILNAARATIQGGEVSVGFVPTHNLNIQFGAAYTDGTYDSFPNALITIPKPAGGNTQLIADASGKTMIRTPKFTYSTQISYKRDTAIGRLDASGNLFWSSGFYGDVNDRLKQSSYTVVNAELGWTPVGSPVRFSIWAKNLTDQTYAIYFIDSTLGDRLTYAPPRSAGGRLSVKF